MIPFEGTVTRSKYRSRQNDGFQILELENGANKYTVKGHLPFVHPDFYLKGVGDVSDNEDNEKNGKNEKTIIIKKVQIVIPTDQHTIKQYCSILMNYNEKSLFMDCENETEDPDYSEEEFDFSSSIAADNELNELCDYLGTSILDQIENNFDYVEKIAKRFEWLDDHFYNLRRIRSNLLLENMIRSIAAELRDVNPEYAKFAIPLYVFHSVSPEIHDQYTDVLSCLKENPYAFCFHRNLPGFTFDIADTIAAKYDLPKDSYDRCCAGTKHTFYSIMNSDGHVFLTEERLLHDSMELLSVSDEVLVPHMNSMYQNQILVRETPSRVYLKEIYDMEVYIAGKLVEIDSQETEPNLISPDFEKIESELGIVLSEEQKAAIKGAVNSNVTLITGGPGTGKTTIIRGIIAAFEATGECSIKLAAPTGKAAVRLRDSTKREALTIHRLLGIKPNSSCQEVSEIVDSAIIIDESSMIDIDLMDKLMHSISLPAHLILVGDANQLPPVGPGYIFHDVIEAKCFNTFRLSQVFRQESHSTIKLLAEKIIHGEIIPTPVKDSDYRFIPAESKADIREKIIEAIDNLLENGYERNDIQVLTPVIEHQCGTKDLNDLLQEHLGNMTGYAYKNKTDTIYSGDRVMQTQNDYKCNVFNGEITEATTVCWNSYYEFGFLKAKYPPNDNEVVYIPRKYNANWVERAYAITVHKSQGSEYPIVIMPVFENKNLYRNLIYTAATRAKTQLVFIGFEKALEQGIINTNPIERNTYLTDRIQDACSSAKNS